MTSSLPDLNIAKTPIYESLVAARGDPYQVDRPAGGWSLPAVSTDFGAANDILGRLLAQGGSDGQGWVAVVLVGGPAAAQLSQQLAQGTMAGLPPAPLAFEAGPSGYQPGYDHQSYGDTGTIPAVTDDHIAARMASNMAAGIVRNALQASSPSGFLYDQYANQPGSRPDPYAASALTPAPAYPGAVQVNPLDSSGNYPVVPQPEMDQPGMGMMPTMAFPPPTVPMLPGAYPSYPGATYAAMERSANGRFGRFASAVRELRRR